MRFGPYLLVVDSQIYIKVAEVIWERAYLTTSKTRAQM